MNTIWPGLSSSRCCSSSGTLLYFLANSGDGLMNKDSVAPAPKKPSASVRKLWPCSVTMLPTGTVPPKFILFLYAVAMPSMMFFILWPAPSPCSCTKSLGASSAWKLQTCWPFQHLSAAHPGVEGPRDLARVDDAIRVKNGRHVGQRTLAHDEHIGTHHVCPSVQQGALVQVHPHAFQREHGKVLLVLRFLALRIPLHRAPQMDVCILHVRFAYALDHVEIEAVVDEASAIPLDASPHHVDRNG
mmetsp:Transcript_52250/g.168268  ORF Transcript_52250/g.168268 Transcript_52250/m.168268 type:complete len:244 (+) Transcript_52250:777-1508(+)